MTMKTLGQRVKGLRTQLGYTQTSLAKRVGVVHVTIHQWEQDDTAPRGKNLHALARALGCEASWLLSGGKQENVGNAVVGAFGIPLLNDVRAGYVPEIEPAEILAQSKGVIYSDQDLSSKAFALKVLDDSMEPDFLNGDVVIFDPAVEPQPGEFVVARNSFTKEATFKKYRPINKDDFELVPLNNDYPPMRKSDYHLEIVGTMIEHRIFRRKR